MNLPMAEVFEVATFYHHFEVLRGDAQPAALTVRVCDGLSCELAGARAQPVPGELWRVDAEGDGRILYGHVLHANGVALSPGERTIYHSDTRSNVILVHTLADDGAAGDRHAFHFPPGAPDGMAIDAQGLLWVASAGAGCVARMTPDGEIDRVLEVPAKTVTSVCFEGDDERALYVVTADNTEEPDRGGTIFRMPVDVAGATVNPARI